MPDTDPRAATLEALADFLVPAHKAMPRFGAVCDWDAASRALGFRPDLKEAFGRGLAADLSGGPEAALEALYGADKDAFDAVTTIVVTTYYMNPRVRALLGYPGQENVAYDPHATQSYLTDGSLAKVIARGRKYRPTPGSA